MRAKHLLVEFYNPSLDELGKRSFDDTRRPRLTFAHLQALRKSKDLEKVDRLQHHEFLPDMYSAPAEEAPPPM